jgi:type VI secretion system protein ImpL
VVLVLSARTLLAGSAGERTALPESLRSQLSALESQYEFALPVYVVICGMDSVKGYTEFWQAQDTMLPHEMVGWSMPQLAQAGAPSEWVDTAFDYLAGQLKRLQVQTAAEIRHIDPDQADQFFLFPRHFLQLREPLRQCMTLVMQPSAWQAGGFCRGLYFTGALPPALSALEGSAPDPTLRAATSPSLTT